MKRLLFVCIIALGSFKSFSWSEFGHKLVAKIAKAGLSEYKQVIDSVQYFLGNMSFEEASVWMDEMRKNTEEYNDWHYINIEKDNTYVKSKEPNVVNKLEWAISVLENKKPRKKEDINFALKVLFHLIGDIHQPLHSGYPDDKGGNGIMVSYAGEQVKLHALWDYNIIKEERINLSDCIKLAKEIPIKEYEEIQKKDIVKWMNEAREYLPFVYGFEKGKINSDYSSKAKPIIEKQLVRASIRLAAILFRNFKR